MKSCRMSDRRNLRRCVGVAVLAGLMSAPAGGPGAQEAGSFTMPVRHGLVLSYRYPAGWRPNLARHTPAIEWRSPDGKTGYFYVELPNPTDRWLKRAGGSDEKALALFLTDQEAQYAKHKGIVLRRTGPARLIGQAAYHVEFALKSAGPKAPPSSAYFETLYKGRQVVRTVFIMRDPEAYRRWRPELDGIVASIRVEPAIDAPADRPLIVRFESQRVRLSFRRGYYLDARVGVYHERRWKPVYRAFAHGSAEKPRGRMLVELVAPDPGMPGRLFVSLEGLAVAPHPVSDFLGSTEILIGRWFGKPTKVAETTARIPGYARLAFSAPRRGSSTRGTYIRTYRVAGRDGATLMVKAYTAGGMTAVANVFLVAPEERFEALLAAADAWARAVRITLYSSAFRWGPR